MNAPLPATTQSTERLSALPEPWIDRLFGRLEGLYGAKFHEAWRGTDLENVKRTWAEKLAGFADRPGCLKSALDACDDRPWPPTLPEFLGLCRDAARRSGTVQLALTEPKMGKGEAAKRMKELTQGQVYGVAPQPLTWAEILRKKYLSGETLLPVQINLASGELGEEWENGQCLPMRSSA